MLAAQEDHLPIVQYLAEQGAALDMADKVRTGEDICYAILVVMIYVLFRMAGLPSCWQHRRVISL